MPITPFHFGPGAAIHAIAPKRISFIAFCAANVLIDIEPFYYMRTGQFPLHRFFHTYIGATLIIFLAIALFIAVRAGANRLRLPNLFGWRDLSTASVATGAAFGSYTHVVFDSIMHSDIRPFAPLSDSNPLLRAIPLDTLHWSCVLAGAIGIAILLMRKLRGAND
ncbi:MULTISPECIES: DUF4184 family protein [unclassified Duganella]|uniref:DUF4184 family protein n=1 Tax=unclassified Duganella TaxID=2636909 RepID=UPI0006F5F550|nr:MULTISPECIES: DUF4184 family protein [unclassified Duganella]KQV54026.1 hypothetical protein ASD07_05650 [Duganella sp. Root336D2]KRB98238.1 hypothetical protein ASE26_25325 [Duganella sp. Root198D2]